VTKERTYFGCWAAGALHGVVMVDWKYSSAHLAIGQMCCNVIHVVACVDVIVAAVHGDSLRHADDISSC
jgi:hypothetical protein